MYKVRMDESVNICQILKETDWLVSLLNQYLNYKLFIYIYVCIYMKQGFCFMCSVIQHFVMMPYAKTLKVQT